MCMVSVGFGFFFLFGLCYDILSPHLINPILGIFLSKKLDIVSISNINNGRIAVDALSCALVGPSITIDKTIFLVASRKKRDKSTSNLKSSGNNPIPDVESLSTSQDDHCAKANKSQSLLPKSLLGMCLT
jgi:hypothetical protein